MEPLFPSCSLGLSDSFLFSAFLGSEKLILVKEEEEKGNKMLLARDGNSQLSSDSGVGAMAVLVFQGFL